MSCSPASQEINQWLEGEQRTDDQGAVEVSVVPLSATTDELKFEISLNTHTVELNVDLAQVSTLRTEQGASIAASNWDGPLGGHHVTGVLTFPVQNQGVPFLTGAKQITLTIREIDAPERVFSWDLE